MENQSGLNFYTDLVYSENIFENRTKFFIITMILLMLVSAIAIGAGAFGFQFLFELCGVYLNLVWLRMDKRFRIHLDKIAGEKTTNPSMSHENLRIAGAWLPKTILTEIRI